MNHNELVKITGKWLKRQGYRSVILEGGGLTTEKPDAIAWKYGNQSFLIECKVSRQDFLSDKSKSFRQNPREGMGLFRSYICPEGIIQVKDLPHGWGLLWIIEGKVVRISPENFGHQVQFLNRNYLGEISLLTSALRNSWEFRKLSGRG